MAATILLAEDDPALSALIQDFFQAAHLPVVPVYDGEAALSAALAQSFDLLILDVMMPNYTGLEVCQAIRAHSTVPIIFITALGQEQDALAGYRAGADDYVIKPFSISVLVAKAQALLRRSRGLGLAQHQLAYGNILLDTEQRQVWVDDVLLHLRPKEYQILELLLREKGHIVSRDLLIQRVWGIDFTGDERMVDRHVAALRQRLGSAAQHIRSVYGQGYRFGGKEGPYEG
ncbi:MAG: response regulator transcription factor [Lawsonibacter sp.]|jgi:DNA-binding response OmpR family regulator